MKKGSSVLFFLTICICWSQNSEEINPYRIGLKIGAPNTISLEFEYLTPLLNNKVAAFANYTNVSKTIDQVKPTVNVFEIGSNVYFGKNNEGRGLYGSLSYQKIGAKLEIEDYEAEDGTIYEGKAKAKADYNGLNLKLGAKLGRKFFFRTEIGYSFGAIPDQVFVEGTYQGEHISEYFSVEEEIRDWPQILQKGIPIFNIGFGVAF